MTASLVSPAFVARPAADAGADGIELSIVMPCLNEAETLAACIGKAQASIARLGLRGEIVIADNGSTDGSRELARSLGARVLDVPVRGYGAALQDGIRAARGEFVIMGDADDSYDFAELSGFVHKLREGCDLVMGCRLPSGGGSVMPGAMPLLHRWWGNPMFSWMARRWFKAPIHDVYCGLRGLSKAHFERLDQRCTGMEFATEMIIKSSLMGSRIGEVPITLYPDGRRGHRGHLRTFRDGWRTLRFFLMYSPRWLFLVPGAALILLGLLGYGVVMADVSFRGVQFDAHTLLFASLSILAGYQALAFAVFAKTFAIGEGLLPRDERMRSLSRYVTLERGVLVGVVALMLGAGLLAVAVLQWRAVDFGELDYSRTMRWVVPGVTLSALGIQTVLSSFFLSILGLGRR